MTLTSLESDESENITRIAKSALTSQVKFRCQFVLLEVGRCISTVQKILIWYLIICRICDGSHRLAISSCDIKFKGFPEEFDVNWSNMQYPAKRMLDVCKCNSEICKSSISASFQSISSRGEQQPSQF